MHFTQTQLRIALFIEKPFCIHKNSWHFHLEIWKNSTDRWARVHTDTDNNAVHDLFKYTLNKLDKVLDKRGKNAFGQWDVRQIYLYAQIKPNIYSDAIH